MNEVDKEESESRTDKLNQEEWKLSQQIESAINDGRDENELAILYNNRGQIRYKLVEFQKAISDYTEAIKHNNELIEAFYNRGTINYRLGNFKLARSDFEKVLSMNYQFIEAQSALSDTLKQIYHS